MFGYNFEIELAMCTSMNLAKIPASPGQPAQATPNTKMPESTPIPRDSEQSETLANSAAARNPVSPQVPQVPATSESAHPPATPSPITWPSRNTLRREMRLTTDESHRAVHLNELFTILKRRKSFKHAHDDAEGDWYRLACLFFRYVFETLSDVFVHESDFGTSTWRVCRDHDRVVLHPDISKRDCYFLAPKGKYLWVYQGAYYYLKIRSYDMSDRIERMKFLNVVSETFKYNPPSRNEHWREQRKKDGTEMEQMADVKVLKRKDMNGVIGQIGGKNLSASRNAERYIQKKKRKVGNSRLNVQVLAPEVDDELTNGI